MLDLHSLGCPNMTGLTEMDANVAPCMLDVSATVCQHIRRNNLMTVFQCCVYILFHCS